MWDSAWVKCYLPKSMDYPAWEISMQGAVHFVDLFQKIKSVHVHVFYWCWMISCFPRRPSFLMQREGSHCSDARDWCFVWIDVVNDNRPWKMKVAVRAENASECHGYITMFSCWALLSWSIALKQLLIKSYVVSWFKDMIVHVFANPLLVFELTHCHVWGLNAKHEFCCQHVRVCNNYYSAQILLKVMWKCLLVRWIPSLHSSAYPIKKKWHCCYMYTLCSCSCDKWVFVI